MRRSTALLAHTPVRLAELSFPHTLVHVHRTRLAFIHLDNLLHFAKNDREGRIDGFVLAYLPQEVVVLLVHAGDVVTALGFTETGRAIVPLASALRRIRAEAERGELVFCEASMEQLAWMYGSCAAPATAREVPTGDPAALLTALGEEGFSGVLELIASGRVAYVRFEQGEPVSGCFPDGDDGATWSERLQRLLASESREQAPAMAAAVFAHHNQVPVQAPPELLQIYRELFWAIGHAAEESVPDVGLKRGHRLRDSLATIHSCLTAIGRPLDRDPAEIADTQEQLTFALSDWALQLLEELEVIAPGVAPGILQAATRTHRFLLQKAGFYGRLPWTVSW